VGIACSKTNYNLTKLSCLIYKYIHLVVDCLISLPEYKAAFVAAAELLKGSHAGIAWSRTRLAACVFLIGQRGLAFEVTDPT